MPGLPSPLAVNSRNFPRGVIEPLEARIAPASLATFTDSDGDRFTVKVTGLGSAAVTLADPDGDTHGSIATLVLSGTNARSALSIAVTKAASGNGYVDLGQVTGSTVGSFVAANSDLTGGLAFTGTVTSLQLHDVLNGADLTFGGTATAAVTLHLNAVGNGTAITSGERVASLTAKSVGVGTISAPALGPLKTTGGGFFSDFTTPGAVSSISVTGGGVSGHWDALRFGAITVTGGDFTAAVNATETAALLKTTAAIGAVTVTGGNLHDTTLHALGGLTSLTVRKNAAHAGGGVSKVTVDALRVGTLSVAAGFDHSVLLAGANLGSDHALGGIGTAADTFAAARITRVSIAGAVTSGIIGAGFRSDDGVFKDGDDTIVGGTKSGITSFFVGSADAQSYFAGGTFPATVKIGTASVKPKLDARFLVIGGLDAFGPTLTAHLSNDTGASATDGVTSNAGISGTASDFNGVMQVQAGLGCDAGGQLLERAAGRGAVCADRCASARAGQRQPGGRRAHAASPGDGCEGPRLHVRCRLHARYLRSARARRASRSAPIPTPWVMDRRARRRSRWSARPIRGERLDGRAEHDGECRGRFPVQQRDARGGRQSVHLPHRRPRGQRRRSERFRHAHGRECERRRGADVEPEYAARDPGRRLARRPTRAARWRWNPRRSSMSSMRSKG